MRTHHSRIAFSWMGAAILFIVANVGGYAQSNSGDFRGEIVAKWLPDGRNLSLIQPFGYTDAGGQAWDVPAGSETDGASIPKVFWLTHPPFTGKYRSAAVIHDYYCRTQTRSWQETHNVFYEAMRTAGVDERTAKVMWGAVYSFGPRWGDQTRRGASRFSSVQNVKEQSIFMKNLESWVRRANPNRDEIAKAIDDGQILIECSVLAPVLASN